MDQSIDHLSIETTMALCNASPMNLLASTASPVAWLGARDARLSDRSPQNRKVRMDWFPVEENTMV